MVTGTTSSNMQSLFAHEFPLEEGLIYLNHAAVSPWPRRTAAAVRRFADDNLYRGSRNYPGWLETEARLRQRLARLINAPSEQDIALLKSTSEGLSVIAHGLEWSNGDNVVIPAEEFPSNRIVWESLEPLGVEVRQVDLQDGESPEAALFARMDERTRLLSVSAVHYASGLRMDLRSMGRACRRHGVLFCIDAIQWLGALPFDVQSAQADFVVADGHKWMLGPEGVALFYCRADLRERLALHQYGWHMVEHCGEFDRQHWRPAASARRFECGSPNLLGAHALDASLSLLEEVGLEEVSRLVLMNSEYLIDLMAKDDNLELLTSPQDGRYAGIVTFRHRRLAATDLYRQLMHAGVMCAQRGGGVRFSPHFYTPLQHLERALALVRQQAG